MGKAKTENKKNSKVKEVLLDKSLNPVTDESDCAFIVSFFYKGKEESPSSISFNSTENEKESFRLDKKIIERYSGFRRPDERTMEIMRQNALKPNGILALKKYSYECIKFLD